MGVFETNPREEKDINAPTAEPTPAGAAPQPNDLGDNTEQTAGTETADQGDTQEPDTTPVETDH
jgi:hypothetical protein